MREAAISGVSCDLLCCVEITGVAASRRSTGPSLAASGEGLTDEFCAGTWNGAWVDATRRDCGTNRGGAGPTAFHLEMPDRAATSALALETDPSRQTYGPVGILVCPPLPGALRVAEVDLHVRGEREGLSRGQLPGRRGGQGRSSARNHEQHLLKPTGEEDVASDPSFPQVPL